MKKRTLVLDKETVSFPLTSAGNVYGAGLISDALITAITTELAKEVSRQVTLISADCTPTCDSCENTCQMSCMGTCMQSGCICPTLVDVTCLGC